MSFVDMPIKRRYKSVGENLTSDIVNELLKQSISYKRSVGYFKSSVLDFINEGILEAINNNCKIQILTSPVLYKDDIEAIKLGYKNRRDVLENRFTDEFQSALKDLSDENLQILAKIISMNLLDIKILSKKDFGIYHYKVAIFEDCMNNKVVLAGSNNETAGGYGIDYDIVRSFKSWVDYEDVLDEELDFEAMWNGEDDYLDTYSFTDAISNGVIEEANSRNVNLHFKIKKKEKYELFDYQKEAIKKWKDNNYNGFFVMATGTGKTVTSLYGAKELIENNNIITVIAVPYKHLVSQWYEDIVDIFGTDEYAIQKVSSEITNWDNILKDKIFYNNLTNTKKIIIISTIASFYTEKFNKAIDNSKLDRLLIIDEAHNFINKIYQNEFNINYKFKLGLSATPTFGKNIQKQKDLLNFFGGVVYDLPIEKAIGKFLVNYYYKPIFVNATDYDEEEFKKYSKYLAGCYDSKTNKIKDTDKFQKYYRARLRTINMSEEKVRYLEDFISEIKDKNHFIIYCSDGKFDDDFNNIEKVINILNNRGYKPSQFTCSENMRDREQLIERFNDGIFDSLVAIRCLDEGINIPSITTALILSSNDNLREFVQRRGRILRKFKDKQYATIIDVILLPSNECTAIAEIELRRYYEYAKLAINKDELLSKLDNLLVDYNMKIDDILFEDNGDEEVVLDE